MAVPNSIWVAEQVKAVDLTVWRKRYEALTGRQRVPVGTGWPAWADTYEYRMLDRWGMAAAITDYSMGGPPVGIRRQPFTAQAWSYGNHIAWTYDELEKAQAMGFPLSTELSEAARDAYELKADGIIWTGDSAHGLLGFLSITNSTTYTVPNGVGGTPEWLTKTADEIFLDFAQAMAALRTATKRLAMPNTALFPSDAWTAITGTRIGDGLGLTALQWLQQAHPQITTWALEPMLDGQGAGGTDMIRVYQRDPAVVAYYEPRQFMFGPVEQKVWAYTQHAMGKMGGVIARRPVEILDIDGV